MSTDRDHTLHREEIERRIDDIVGRTPEQTERLKEIARRYFGWGTTTRRPVPASDPE